MEDFTPLDTQLFASVRLAHLATADGQGAPHVVPVCFVYDRGCIYSVIDRKPKRTSALKLKRVRNILANPRVALVFDHYEEDWSRLWYVLVRGTAQLLAQGEEHQRAVDVLRQKYHQYQDMDIDACPIIKLTPTSVVRWGRPHPNAGARPSISS